MNDIRPLTVVVALVGLLAAGVLIVQSSMAMSDALALIGLAAGTAVVAAVGGGLVLHWLRGASLRRQLAVMMLVPLVGVSTGAWFAAREMFFSSHDLSVLALVLVSAGTVSGVAALVLSDRLTRSSDSLVTAARDLGEGRRPAPAAAHDASELRRLGTELEATARKLEEARRRERALETSRRELIAWVSHDLRTPLAGIRAIAEALEDELIVDGSARRDYYQTLRVEAERLTELVDDLFELSRAQAGVVRLELEEFSLGDLVSDALAGITPVADAKGIRIEGRVRGSIPDLCGSAPELLRALRNILENAVRHTPSEGAVVVETGSRDGQAYVSVLDGGGGIPESQLGRVFEAGFQGDPARSPGGGAGLGLAIARELVEAHQGEISVHNENGGARFEVRLPVTSQEPS